MEQTAGPTRVCSQADWTKRNRRAGFPTGHKKSQSVQGIEKPDTAMQVSRAAGFIMGRDA